jgi:hypothetical protein
LVAFFLCGGGGGGEGRKLGEERVPTD